MIAYLNGTVIKVEASYVVIDVGGVGYKVAVPVSVLTSLPEIGGKTQLNIYTYIRPEEIALYGFQTSADQRVFELLLSVSGIGPKVGLSILSAMDAQTLCKVVAGEDTRSLIRIPGLGMKTAQRLILELREKLAAFIWELKGVSQEKPGSKAGATSPETSERMLIEDVSEGLTNLGYNRADARRAAEKAVLDLGESAAMGATLRAALNVLTNSGSR